MVFGVCRGVFESGWAQAQYRQIDIWIILGKIGFEWFSAHAEGFLKAVGRKPNTVYVVITIDCLKVCVGFGR
jgi:hypothetical protein